jgi:hypothetical protein
VFDWRAAICYFSARIYAVEVVSEFNETELPAARGSDFPAGVRVF